MGHLSIFRIFFNGITLVTFKFFNSGLNLRCVFPGSSILVSFTAKV
jgi:hypothetical protein